MEYTDVIYHSDWFFKPSSKITLSWSCDPPYIEYSDVIYHSDQFFKPSSKITLSSSCDLLDMEHSYESLTKLRLVLQTRNRWKIQCDHFSVSVFPTVSKFCATITKITDFTNRGTQKLAEMQISSVKGNISSGYLNYQ